jgi:class 3 adenylate cyclase
VPPCRGERARPGSDERRQRPITEDDDLFGTAVQLAARITDRAEPGQVLVSRVVAGLCAGKGFEFTSVGDATLKGFDEPVALYEVRSG